MVILTVLYFCSERERTNPFDTNYPRKTMPLILSLLPLEQCNRLSWDTPLFDDYSGFNIYRRLETDTAYQLISKLPRGHLTYNDSSITYGLEHDYYFTITGESGESKPSAVQSTIPGPGYNWIVDKWGYQIFKTSYDTRHLILRCNRSLPPQDMAIAREYNLALLTYIYDSVVEIVDLATGEIVNQLFTISTPYKTCYDSVDNHFWVIDSSGPLYKINPVTHQVQLIDNSMLNPIEMTISEQRGLINIVDYKAKMILRYNRHGSIIEVIDQINGFPLQGPQKFVYDEQRQRYWFLDGNNQKDYIYTKRSSETTYQCIDSLNIIGDFELHPAEDAILIISLPRNGTNNSSVMQLYANGDRQTVIADLIYPLDIGINKYDESILIADSYHGRVLHYNREYKLLGFSNIYNFPIKILVE